MPLTDTLFRLHLYFYLQWRERSAYARAVWEDPGTCLVEVDQADRAAHDALDRAGRILDLCFTHRNLLPEKARSLHGVS